MKLSKRLISSGTLQRGEVRHCSEWEFPEWPSTSRFGGREPYRLALQRRADSKGERRPVGIFGWIRGRGK